MKKLYFLIFAFFVSISCSEETISEHPESNSNQGQPKLPGQEIVAFPFNGTVSEVYYGGQKTLVEIYNNSTYVYEGDILLSPDLVTLEEVKLVYEKGETPPPNKSVGKTLNRWPNSTVFYSIDPNLPDQHRVFDAIKHWEERTNLKFVERSFQKNYIFFTPGNGCSSFVGMQGGKQEITLASSNNSYCTTGATIHEIGHAVGLWHEQSRMDRDNFITIHYDNIEPGKEHNFMTYGERKMDGAELTEQLDFESIMMYGPHDFSKNGNPTITKRNGGVYNVNRTYLSPDDIFGIQLIYSDNPPSYETRYRNGNYYVIDGVNVFRMHDRWYFYTSTGWRELKRKEGYWYFMD